MLLTHKTRKNRFAQVKAMKDVVLYDAYEGNTLIYTNMALPYNAFKNEYTI